MYYLLTSTLTVAAVFLFPLTNAIQAAEPINDSLQKSYEREYAFLEAQSRVLRESISKLNHTIEQDKAVTEKTINQLESTLLSKRSKKDNLEQLLLESERSAQTKENSTELLQTTYLQAASTLAKFANELTNPSPFNDGNDQQKITRLFSQANQLVTQLSAIRQVPGTFFLQDGSKVSGTIVKVGNIAAYGLSDQSSGMLAPAGAGHLKLWPEPAMDSATAVASMQTPATLKLFLFESQEQEIKQHQDKTPLATIKSGGTIAWVIVGLGILAALLILLRIIFLKSASSSTEKITRHISQLIREDNIEAALAYCKKHRGATSRVINATLRNIHRSRDHLEDIISENILHENTYLDRFGAFILVLAAVAPLLGLLGTVTGMIATFDIITEFGTGDPKLLSGGISIALITTEVGLIVAIPTLIIGNLLSGWAEKIKHDMERAALRITNVYQDRRMEVQENVRRIA